MYLFLKMESFSTGVEPTQRPQWFLEPGVSDVSSAGCSPFLFCSEFRVELNGVQ